MVSSIVDLFVSFCCILIPKIISRFDYQAIGTCGTIDILKRAADTGTSNPSFIFPENRC